MALVWWTSLFVAVILSCIQVSSSTGHIEVHFMSYSDSCKEDMGMKCEPYFQFCLSRPQSGRDHQLYVDKRHCHYAASGPSNGHFHGSRNLDFSHMSNILGLSNPWIVQVGSFYEDDIMLVADVTDADRFTKDDHLHRWGKILTETVWPSRAEAQWGSRTMYARHSRYNHRLNFRIRLYCDPFFYTKSCDVMCKPQDSTAGHYTCDKTTGGKICRAGWEGRNCDEDVDECQQTVPVCNAGKCTNMPGSFNCECPEGFKGRFCESHEDPCRSNPCHNGGECYSHSTKQNYTCKCREGWEGPRCSVKRDPCNPNPCQNGGDCNSHWRNQSYTCKCPEGWEGPDCGLKRDPCRSNPCQNGGDCYSHPTEQSYTCMCREGWEGPDCGVKSDPCKTSPCKNKGVCVSNRAKTSYHCDCSYPHSGPHCEKLFTTTTTTTATTAKVTEKTTMSDNLTATVEEKPLSGLLSPFQTTNASVTTSQEPEIGRAKSSKATSDEDVSMPFWLWALAGALCLLALVLVIVIFVIKRRGKGEDQMPPVSYEKEDAAFTGGNLAFTNEVFHTAFAEGEVASPSSSRMPDALRELPPIPVGSTDTDPDQSQRAMGSCKSVSLGICGDRDILEKVSETLMRYRSGRAEPNDYADITTLSRQMSMDKETPGALQEDVEPESGYANPSDVDYASVREPEDGQDEPHYSTLDEMSGQSVSTPAPDLSASASASATEPGEVEYSVPRQPLNHGDESMNQDKSDRPTYEYETPRSLPAQSIVPATKPDQIGSWNVGVTNAATTNPMYDALPPPVPCAVEDIIPPIRRH